MGYFDGYKAKSKSKAGIIVDGEQLDRELNAYGSISADVTKNKYGYGAEDVINVAKLLHEANARKLSVKTEIENSPLLYKKAKDSSGKDITVKRGHFEKKKLLKDARAYEERMQRTDISIEPVQNNSLDENIDDTQESLVKEPIVHGQIVEESVEKKVVVEEQVEKEPIVEEPVVEELEAINEVFLDEKRFSESDDEFPAQTSAGIVLNKKDKKFLAAQDLQFSHVDMVLLKFTSVSNMHKMEDSTEPATKEIHENMTDEELIDILRYVKDEIFESEGETIRCIRNTIHGSNFVNAKKLCDDFEDILLDRSYKFTKIKKYELGFKFKLLAIAVAKMGSEDTFGDGKLFLQLSRALMNS